jgi:hypothetical protein
MMKTMLPLGLNSVKHLLTLAALQFVVFSAAYTQNFKGKDGAQSATFAGTYIGNRYSALALSASAGALSFTVADINELSGSHTFPNAMNPYATNALSKGDLVMIIQMQGADITTTDDANYGAITNYNNTGNYEVRTVFNVSGNTILLCENLVNNYTQGGRARTQVVRIPRLTNATIGAGVTITGLAWNGTVGGVVALETSENIVIDGNLSANAIGFRGGVDDKVQSSVSGSGAVTLYRTTSSATTGSKGESIAGNSADYNTYLNGAYGRGAVANGGGGGNGHNSAGGGGANAGNNGALAPWNGTGIKNTSTPAWANAWNLEAASFATDFSTGGGRGGYTYSNINQDALTTGTGNTLWGGDFRNNVGGFGGRPMDYNGNTRLFAGGGGGAGDGNNNSAGDGGTGGGIVFVLANGNLSGSGSITANGEAGYNTQGSNIDAAGGGGGGGAIVANVHGNITGISMQANGGDGGQQLYLTGEAEGPGGGGGGGYISTTTTSVSRLVNGGDNGYSQSAQVTEFTPNGATQGAAGTIASRTFRDVNECEPSGYVLPIKLLSFTAVLKSTIVELAWVTENENNSDRFEVERSFDGQVFTSVENVKALNKVTGNAAYFYDNNVSTVNYPVIYYRLKMIDANSTYLYSEIRIVRFSTSAIANKFAVYPNPAINQLYINLPAEWQGKKVKMELYDVTGKQVKAFEKNAAASTESIAIHELGKGFYVVRASMNGQQLQQQLIKN